jgi:fructan beta-fructosidase
MRGENNLGNAWNIHNASASNFVYEGTLTLEHGNAAGLEFRSNATSSASYDLILDHVDGLFKLSKRSPYQVLAHYPMVVEYNRPYQVRLVVQGDWMQAYLDNQLLLEVGDGSYTAGQFGVMLFQATASYDNLRAWESAP